MITDEQAAELSGTWKILLDCDAEIPSMTNSIASTSVAIWTMVSMEQTLIDVNDDLAKEIAEYGLESHQILKELDSINTKLSDLYVKTSLAIQAIKNKNHHKG